MDVIIVVLAIVAVLGGTILLGYLRNRRQERKAEHARDNLSLDSGVRVGTIGNRRQNVQSVLPFGTQETISDSPAPKRFLVLYVDFPEDKPPALEYLKLSLRARHLDSGQGEVFHSYADTSRKQGMRYSVAEGVEPGFFSHDENSQLYSVVLFMGLPNCDEPGEVFSDMLETARHLAESYRGRVVDEQGTAIGDDSSNTVMYYRDQIKDFLREEAT